jgi:iron complex outermembrane receptor protein
VLAAATAAAQDNAVKSAADAFGERVGTEQAGLYSETQVRGFDLNDSGAYRIDDAYFSRAAALNDSTTDGSAASRSTSRLSIRSSTWTTSTTL